MQEYVDIYIMLYKIFIVFLISFNCINLISQDTLLSPNFSQDCNTDFWTISAEGLIQQWSLVNDSIIGGDTVLTGGGLSLAFCGSATAPTFYTDNWNQGGIGINYYALDTGWINIPSYFYVQDNGGHLNDQYFTVVGAVIQYVTYWDPPILHIIDSLPGEFFTGIFDIAVDTSGRAWVFTSSFPGTAVDSLKVYNSSGQITAYSFPYDVYGYGSFFLNDTLYVGASNDSIYPILINGPEAELGNGIPFSAKNFTDMASCQTPEIINAIAHLENQKIEIFPNPTFGIFTLSVDFEKEDISVYNSLGKLIDFKIEGNRLDIREQSAGIYYLNIYSEGLPKSYTIMKY